MSGQVVVDTLLYMPPIYKLFYRSDVIACTAPSAELQDSLNPKIHSPSHKFLSREIIFPLKMLIYECVDYSRRHYSYGQSSNCSWFPVSCQICLAVYIMVSDIISLQINRS